MNGLFFGAALVFAFMFGYARAHHVIATECKKLGKFYVNDEVFECVKITSEKTKGGQQ